MTTSLGGEKVVARTAAKQVLAKAYASEEAALVSVVGRRRVGKTFLVRQVFAEQLVFQVTGLASANMALQLGNFREQLRRSFPDIEVDTSFTNWLGAFAELARRLDVALASDPGRRVVFLDELPWLASAKSGFLQGFSWFWNSWAYDKRIVAVICGSAASWMVRRVVRDRGSLHNRITHRIQLRPFTLAETAEYLDVRGAIADPYQRLQLYMALGGVPFYLKLVEPAASAQQEIQRLLFDEDAPLAGEFDVLFASLFDRPERHLAIVRALAAAPGGLRQNQLAGSTGLAASGALTKVLEELELSGFIDRSRPFGAKRKGRLIRLVDEYSAFYLRWIEPLGSGPRSFHRIAESSAYRSWAGFAYERTALRHGEAIKRALGIAGVDTLIGSYVAKANEHVGGVQIDMLLDRADRTITLIEAKFSIDEFILTKAYAMELREKVSRFRRHSGTRKHVQLVLLTTYGMRASEHAVGLVDRVLVMGYLFEGA